MAAYFLVGTYSEPILFGTGEVFEGKGKGVYLCALSGGKVETLGCLPLGNPSFVAVDEKRGHIYAVNEMKEFQGEYGGGLTDILFERDGRMEVIAQFGTGGTDPCHVAVSPDGRYVCVANFADGHVTAFRLDEEGAVLPERTVFEHRGSGAHPVRQTGPHAHSIIFSGDGRMFVPDLGIDKLKAYVLKEDGIAPDEERTVSLEPGSGPRWGEWSPDGKHLYVVNELASSVTHLRYEDGKLAVSETVGTLPAGDGTDNICADLHLTPDGPYLYASNRGHDTIAAFRVEEDGALTPAGWEPCGGKTPRNFSVDPSGQYLLVGNQDSDNITVFSIGADGQLTRVAQNDFPTPVCIRFLKEGIR